MSNRVFFSGGSDVHIMEQEVEVDQQKERARSVNTLPRMSSADAPPKVPVLFSHFFSHRLFSCYVSYLTPLLFYDKPSRIRSSCFNTLGPNLHLQVILLSTISEVDIIVKQL